MIKCQGCARDLLGRDRDETRDADVRDRDETETRDTKLRDRDETFCIRDETETETLQLPRR